MSFLTPEIVRNVRTYLERVPLTGREAFDWCRCYSTLQMEEQILSAPPAAPEQPQIALFPSDGT